MSTCHHYYDEVELDDGRLLRIEFAQWKTPATFDDPAEVDTSEPKVYVDGKRVHELLELEPIVRNLFENGDPVEMSDPGRPY